MKLYLCSALVALIALVAGCSSQTEPQQSAPLTSFSQVSGLYLMIVDPPLKEWKYMATWRFWPTTNDTITIGRYTRNPALGNLPTPYERRFVVSGLSATMFHEPWIIGEYDTVTITLRPTSTKENLVGTLTWNDQTTSFTARPVQTIEW
ncbi:MAG: hypothetical protein HYX66_08845 [Ignavibacteria bacterium]|nr:hypothetical protein [Ignavibacteria bacterium]